MSSFVTSRLGNLAALPLPSAVRLRLTDRLVVFFAAMPLGRDNILSSEFAGIGGAAANERGALGKAQPYRTGQRPSRKERPGDSRKERL
jgi:hypothetical protein